MHCGNYLRSDHPLWFAGCGTSRRAHRHLGVLARFAGGAGEGEAQWKPAPRCRSTMRRLVPPSPVGSGRATRATPHPRMIAKSPGGISLRGSSFSLRQLRALARPARSRAAAPRAAVSAPDPSPGLGDLAEEQPHLQRGVAVTRLERGEAPSLETLRSQIPARGSSSGATRPRSNWRWRESIWGLRIA